MNFQFMVSLLLFYMKGEVNIEKNMVRASFPNTIFKLIPLGKTNKTIPVNQISSIDDSFRLDVKAFILGIIAVIFGFSVLSDSVLFGILLLVYGVSTVVSSFETILVVYSTAGVPFVISFVIFEKEKALQIKAELDRITNYHNDSHDLNIHRQQNLAGMRDIMREVTNFPQYDQYGNPVNGQQNYQNGQQQYNQNFQGNNGYQGYNGQNPQGHEYQQFNQYGQPVNPNYQGQPNHGYNSNFQGQPNHQGYQNQGQNQNYGQNPNGPSPQQPNHPGQPNQGVNPNGPRPQQPNHPGQPNQSVNPNQGQNPNGPSPQQPTNQGSVNQGVNPNHQEPSPVKEAPKPQETVEIHETSTPEVNESVEVKKEVNETSSVQGGAKSRRLQKLNKPEEEQTILKRRNK
ncbi:hypothetical protein O3797_04875 [Gemella sanguinis]|uniref:hypothetical protein n=1 Tax=Gemella sanguinis TaxID=84135 RepID=UPI00352CCEAD